jgi:hypothetical protein
MGRQVVESADSDTGVEVESRDIPSLLSLTVAKVIDLLKIDIEKEELELFSTGCETWLAFVRTICIESRGKDCEELFFGALGNYDFDLSRGEELTICKNLRVRSAVPRARHI